MTERSPPWSSLISNESLLRASSSQNYLFVVDDERHGYLGIVGPLQAFKALLSVAFKVAWERIVWRRCVDFGHDVG
jgi:hypothetical protein